MPCAVVWPFRILEGGQQQHRAEYAVSGRKDQVVAKETRGSASASSGKAIEAA